MLFFVPQLQVPTIPDNIIEFEFENFFQYLK